MNPDFPCPLCGARYTERTCPECGCPRPIDLADADDLIETYTTVNPKEGTYYNDRSDS